MKERREDVEKREVKERGGGKEGGWERSTSIVSAQGGKAHEGKERNDRP